MAHQHRSVPLLSVQVGKARDLAGHVFAGSPNARALPLQSLAWPTTEIGHVDGFSTIRNRNAFDDVIDPGETRERMMRLLAHLPSRTEQRARQLQKKHPIDTW